MMTAAHALNAARTVMPGAPEHAAACELAVLRGYDPNEMVRSVATGEVQVTNWQWLIAEQILEAGLRHMLGQNAAAQGAMNGVR